MAKIHVRLSLKQDVESAAQMISEEARELADELKDAAHEADGLTDDKKEGRILMELSGNKVLVSAIKAKLEKPDTNEG